MTIPLCNRCPKPAFLRTDERTVLCAECWNITWGIVTDRMKLDFESSCGGVDRTREPLAALGRAPESLSAGAGIKPGPQDSIPSVRDTMDGNATVAAVKAPGRVPAAVASSSDDGIPDFLRRTG